MAEVKKVATRVSYGEALVELGNEHDDFVVLDADLAAATQTGKFKAACPDRFFDVGIAESNLMGVAAGIATTGRDRKSTRLNSSHRSQSRMPSSA